MALGGWGVIPAVSCTLAAPSWLRGWALLGVASTAWLVFYLSVHIVNFT